MSIISDYRGIRKQAKAMTPPEHRGLGGGFRAAQDGMAKANQALARLQEEQARQAQLAGRARSGQAVVVALRDTGVTVGDDPVVQLDLTVSAEGLAPFNVTVEQTIGRTVLARCLPGAIVPVEFDAHHPTQLRVCV